MATKTKAELKEEIDQKNEEIKKLEEEIKLLEKYKQYKDMGDELKAMHTAFEVSGFSSDEAFDLLKLMMELAPAMTNNQPKASYRSYGDRRLY